MTQKLTPAFIDQVNARLVKGAQTYGDDAFKSRTVPASLQEIRDELLDVAAYAALTCVKIESLLEVAKPRISKELRRAGLKKFSYPELILILQRNPGSVLYESESTVVVSDPEPGGFSTGLDYDSYDPSRYLDQKVSSGIKDSSRDKLLLQAFAENRVYHLPANP